MVNYSVALAFVFFFITANVIAQDRYAVHYKYKPGSTYSLEHPETWLTQKTLLRRDRDKVLLDSTDLPVSDKYIESLRPYVDDFLFHSKWLNASIVHASSAEIKNIAALDFVNEVILVAKGGPSHSESSTQDYKAKKKRKWFKNSKVVSNFAFQNSILGISDMHNAGYTGEGVLVAIFDAGFLNVDRIPAFDHLFEGNKIVATKDLVLAGANTVFRAELVLCP